MSWSGILECRSGGCPSNEIIPGCELYRRWWMFEGEKESHVCCIRGSFYWPSSAQGDRVTVRTYGSRPVKQTLPTLVRNSLFASAHNILRCVLNRKSRIHYCIWENRSSERIIIRYSMPRKEVGNMSFRVIKKIWLAVISAKYYDFSTSKPLRKVMTASQNGARTMNMVRYTICHICWTGM